MKPKPMSRTFRRGAARTRIRCARCGAQAAEGAAHCRECGQGLIVPEEQACLACGTIGLSAGQACPDCGAYRLRRPAPDRPRPAWSQLAVFAGLGTVLAVVLAVMPGARGQGDPRLAGVAVGDAPHEVERRLGAPEDRGSEIHWQGIDGRSHHMIQWQYGLDETAIADLTVTFIDGKVHQVGALAGAWATSEGLRIGDRLPKAGRLYGTAIEDAPIEGLTPHRFIRGSVVVRVITEAPSDEILAIGVESPKQIPMEALEIPSEPDWHPPVPDTPVPPVLDAEPVLPRQRYY